MRELAVKLEKTNKYQKNFSIKKEQEYLKKFRKPKDDIERSYFQYCCQMRRNTYFVTILLNILSFPVAVFYLLKPVDKPDSCIKWQGVFFSDDKPSNIIPASLMKKIGDIYIIEEKHENMTKWDLMFLYRIFKRYPLS